MHGDGETVAQAWPSVSTVLHVPVVDVVVPPGSLARMQASPSRHSVIVDVSQVSPNPCTLISPML